MYYTSGRGSAGERLFNIFRDGQQVDHDRYQRSSKSEMGPVKKTASAPKAAGKGKQTYKVDQLAPK